MGLKEMPECPYRGDRPPEAASDGLRPKESERNCPFRDGGCRLGLAPWTAGTGKRETSGPRAVARGRKVSEASPECTNPAHAG